MFKKLTTKSKALVENFLLRLCIVNDCILLAAISVTFFAINIDFIFSVSNDNRNLCICIMAAFEQLSI